jgi:hypothetical protein
VNDSICRSHRQNNRKKIPFNRYWLHKFETPQFLVKLIQNVRLMRQRVSVKPRRNVTMIVSTV